MARRPAELRFSPRLSARGAGARRVAGPVVLAVAVYAAVALVSLALASAEGESAFVRAPWLPVDRLELPSPLAPFASHAVALAGGLTLAAATVHATRAIVARFGWAKVLHADLRPSIRDASTLTLVVLGVTSAASEELLFRGALAPLVGVVPSAIAFGLLHQVRGRGRWPWVVWASVMGLCFGVLYFATGSLLGAVVAHAVINVQNLRFLRDTDVEPPSGGARKLGGLLRRV